MRFLFACPTSLFDTGNGAAQTMAALLGGLAARGHAAETLEATVFDSPRGGEHLLKHIDGADPGNLLVLEHAGVRHAILRNEHSDRGRLTADEAERFVRTFRAIIDERRPDVLLTWGGRVLERMVRAEARGRGIRVVFILLNPSYHRAETFADVDLVVTDTAATAALYRERLRVDVKPIGSFVESARYRVARRTPQYITFVNPLPEKGVALFVALARRALGELPEARFLVIESRGTWAGAAQQLHFDRRELTNVYVSPPVADMRVVYEQTRVLLVPSLWHESGPRVVPEALVSGIPVIASDSGGIPENLAGSGFTLTPPLSVKSNWNAIPPDDGVTPWLEVLTRLVRDESFYADACHQALDASAQHDSERCVTRFLELVAPVVH